MWWGGGVEGGWGVFIESLLESEANPRNVLEYTAVFDFRLNPRYQTIGLTLELSNISRHRDHG